MSIASYVLGAIVLLVIFFTMKAVVIISQSETKVIERLGKYYATLQPGINIIMPFLDHAKEVVAVKGGRYVYTSTIDLREQVYDFARQNVITKDNIQMQINALLYFQIVDPFKAVYEINNLPNAIEKLTQTTLRNIIGEMELDQHVDALLVGLNDLHPAEQDEYHRGRQDDRHYKERLFHAIDLGPAAS